jgi:hypothetical protein
MGVSAEIYLATSTAPGAVAGVLERIVPGAAARRPDDGDETLVDLPAVGGATRIGGPVGDNYLSGALDPEDPDDPEDDEPPSVDDAYPVLWELQGDCGGAEAFRCGAMEIFEYLAEHLPCPMLLTFDVDALVMASLPGEGVTRFAADVTPYAEDRRVWARFFRVASRPLE